jgi:O-antigen ligase
MRRHKQEVPLEDFYALKLRAFAAHFMRERFSFWMICGYLVIEYVRPQSLIPGLDIIPWGQIFLMVALVTRFADSSARWVADPVNKWMTLFLAVILLSSALAAYPDQSWVHINDYFTWFVIYFLVINIVTSERRFLIFLAIFLLASFKLSSFGARTWAMQGFAFSSWGIMGPPGFFANSGELAIQMLMFAPIAYQLAVFVRPYASKLRYYILLSFPVTAAMTVMGASSRGAQIGLAYQIYRKFIKGRLNFKTILIASAVVILGWVLLPDEQKARFTSVGSDRTSQQRILYWRNGVEMIKENPVLGVGFFNFPKYFETHYPEDMLYPRAELPHNIFIQVGTDAGLLGLGIYLMILYRNFRSVREIRALCKSREEPSARLFDRLAFGLSISAWGFIVAGQFVTVAYYPFLWINLALTVSLRNIAGGRFPVPSVTRPVSAGAPA